MKIFCVGRNYSAHAKEMNSAVPDQPVIFMKPSTALLPFGKTFFLPNFSKEIHYETELVVKIGKQGKSIPKSQALDFVSAYTLGIDFTARDVQRWCKSHSYPWELAKSFDFSAAIGQWRDLTDPHVLSQIQFELQINQEVRQQGEVQHMIFDIPTLIHFISERFTLQKGDIIYTGTPQGVGPVKDGDVLEGYIHGEKLLFTPIKG